MHDEMFLVFGGYSYQLIKGGEQTIIAQYNPDADTGGRNDGWKKLGDLITKGYKHDVISSKGEFLIIGHGKKAGISTEKCFFDGEKMKCVNQEPLIFR